MTFERVWSVMVKPWVMVGYWGMVAVSFCYFDPLVASHFQSIELGEIFPWLHGLTQLGSVGIYLIFLPLLALLFQYGVRNLYWARRIWFVWGCVFVPSLICLVLKVTLSRARPELLFLTQEYGFYFLRLQSQYWSFPSGHTTTIMGLVFGLGVVFPRYGYWLLGVGIAVACSRVVLTHHYLSDVLATAYLTLMELGLLCWILKNKCNIAVDFLPDVFRAQHVNA